MRRLAGLQRNFMGMDLFLVPAQATCTRAARISQDRGAPGKGAEQAVAGRAGFQRMWKIQPVGFIVDLQHVVRAESLLLLYKFQH